jgi:hypothetical protein
MPRLIAALPLLAATALAACHQPQSTEQSAAKTGEVSLTNASPSEVVKQAKAASPAHFSPGQWETAVEITALELPGVPPQIRDQMKKAMMTTTKVAKTCMTREQAEKPEAGVLTGKNDDRCTYKNYKMANGRIDATLVCTGQQGMQMTQTISGTFTETSFALDSSMDATGGPGGGMKMQAKTSGKRIGECPTPKS